MKTMFAFIALVLSLSSYAQIQKARTNLFELASRDTQGKTPKQIERENLENYERFVSLDVNSDLYNPHAAKDLGKRTTITKMHAETVINEAERNPVVSLHQYNKYDKDNKGIGFCFGRAMFIHQLLALSGVNRGNIKKAFIIGPMSNGSWAWHVTTIAQGKVGNKEVWYAMDPAVGYPLDVKAWYKFWLRESDDQKLKLYITEAGKFAADPSTYDEREKTNKWYNNYFRDMHDWFYKNDVRGFLK